MVTVVITTCKREPETVERAVSSVIGQTYQDWELIVVDDSPEGYEFRSEVRETVLKHAESHRVIYKANPENSGACFSRNVGLEMAQGEYIAFLDDDDEWLPEKLAKQTEALEYSEPGTAMVYCPFYSVTDDTGEERIIRVSCSSGRIYDELMEKGNFIGGMSMPMMRTDAVREAGGFDILMQSAQDMDLWLRIARDHDILFQDLPLVIYHLHSGEQITTNMKKKIAGMERINEKNMDYLNVYKDIKWKKKMNLIKYYLLNNDKKKAITVWKEAAGECPYRLTGNLKELIRIVLS